MGLSGRVRARAVSGCLVGVLRMILDPVGCLAIQAKATTEETEMNASTLTMLTSGPANGPGNPAIVTAHYRKINDDAPGQDEHELAYVLLAAALAQANVAAGGQVLSASTRPVGDPIGGGSLDIPWNPTRAAAVYAKLAADNPAGVLQGLPAGGMATPFAFDNGGTLAVAGSGVTLQGGTSVPGRKGRKRMYLPHLSEQSVDNSGGVSASAQATAKASFNYFLTSFQHNEFTVGPISVTGTGVEFLACSLKYSTEDVITSYKVSTLPCRLRTRTR